MDWRGRRGRRGRGDAVALDPEKTAAENVQEVLVNICRRSGVGGKDITEEKKVSYLSALVTLLQETSESGQQPDLGLRVKEILLCLRIPLTSPSPNVRAGTLRAVRYLVRSLLDVMALSSVQLPLLLTRTLDLDLDNKGERLQGVKLARRLLLLGASHFPPSVVRSLLAIVQRGGKEKNRDLLWRTSLALLCELSTLNPELLLEAGGARILTSSLLDCFQMPRVTEAVVGCLLRLFNLPTIRILADLDLSPIVAPFTEVHYVHCGLGNKAEESRIESSVTALLSILRSWPGLLHLSHPALPSRPLASLLDTLYLPSYDTRKTILDLVYKSLRLQVPDWTDEFEVAMRTADPSAPRDSWKLTEGFVAAEGQDILPHLAKSRPNLVEAQTALLLSCYLQAGLPSALIRVIVTSDTVLSVRAAVLLGQFLHLVSSLLPHEIAATVNCLPLLSSHMSAEGVPYSPVERTRATAAVLHLQKLHQLKKRGPRPSSLLLEQVLEHSGLRETAGFLGDRLKLGEVVDDGAGGIIYIRNSGVLEHRDPQSWKWDLILATLKWPPEALRKLEDSSCKIFLKKVTDFYLPSTNMFSRLELDSSRTRFHGRVGCCLLDFLLSCLPTVERQERQAEPEAAQRLDTLLAEVMKCLEEVIHSSSPHDCVLSPTRLTNTACQLYFLFIGRLSRTETGRGCLDRHQTLPLLTSLLGVRHDIYLKLVVSCMDYRTDEWGARTHLLTKALTAAPEGGRVYATRWLRVLARMGASSIAVYGVELLVRQLRDHSLTVASTALTILDEVCDDKMFLESLVSHSSLLLSTKCQAALEALGDRGRLLLVKCVGSTTGLTLLQSNSWLQAELARWNSSYNLRYVVLVEMLLSDGFSLHQRSEDGHGTYGRRTGDDHQVRDVFLPPHLYGQLAQTRAGLDILLAEAAFWAMLLRLTEVEASPEALLGEEELLEAKAAVWGVASVAAAPAAATLLEQRGALAALVSLAETCPVVSLRGTAYYALGLVATTRPGAVALGQKGWATVRHQRGEAWPIATDWLEASEVALPGLSPAHQPQASPGGGWEQQQEEEVEESQMLSLDSSLVTSPARDRLSSRLSAKVSNWFRSSLESSGSRTHRTSTGGSSRRNSEGSKGSGATIATKLRASFRRGERRNRTVSVGSLPSREATPEVVGGGQESLMGESEGEEKMRFKKKLSFGGDDQDGEVGNGVEVAASPGDPLPGEIFPLQDISEEPERSVEVSRRLPSTSSSGFSSQGSVVRAAPRLSPIPSQDHTISLAIDIGKEGGGNDDSIGRGEGDGSSNSVVHLDGEGGGGGGGSLGDSVPPPSLSDIPSMEGVVRGEGALLGVIRQGTSVSSVSSVGSFTFQDVPGYSGRQSRRRPQLSESEDGEPVSGRDLGKVARQDTFSRNTFPARGKQRSLRAPDTSRSVSVPPKPFSSLPSDSAKEPAYWGLAHPLSQAVLYPPESSTTAPPTLTTDLARLPAILGSLLVPPSPSSSSSCHSPAQCLACYRLQLSARPRASSLTAAAQGREVKGAASTSLPPSHQSPALARRSWVGGESESPCILPKTNVGGQSSSPTGWREARTEALDLVCLMNNSVKAKAAEAALVRLQKKWPSVFTDLCFYSDVSHLLGVYSFRLASRRFIQELFLEVDFSRMDEEAMHVLGQNHIS